MKDTRHFMLNAVVVPFFFFLFLLNVIVHFWSGNKKFNIKKDLSGVTLVSENAKKKQRK